ncbi:class 1 fructose-bisphosphatase [Aeoliella mucimassa]|uniref:Fructose-1,6-bisphosphatase class 1 n=1 Tax=Aeoliella mucimassa TaxID=2527972 RepID=A0A518AQ24_9BACT|nr:class 1 fructose-bisphosphatase [Aeoliella mucimassa]QDU56829.1 Fructose-1,6-bisphosphatase class 1 [Aeoliella mucimassa]
MVRSPVLSLSEPVIITAEQHIQLQQRQHSPEATGTFSWLLAGLTLATKLTESRVRRAGLLDVLGSAEHVNVQGEMQQKLDIFADQALIYCLGARDSVAVIASEENEEALIFEGRNKSGKYVIVFDPLDGSSNIDVNVSVGTVFSILRVPEGIDVETNAKQAVLQPGTEQLAAGYVVYGSSTILVYTTGHGVHGFTLDPTIGAYVLSHENIKMPIQGPYYSANEAYWDEFPESYQEYLRHIRSGGLGTRYSSRYIGSMVADFHRTLLKGGVFIYPPTAKSPEGKLRLLYEANPVAFLAEQAGGIASNGSGRVLDVTPTEIHQRTPLVVGSQVEMQAFQRIVEATA